MKKILCHLFIICGTLWGQKPGEVRLLGPAQLQEDFEIAVQSLAEVHPALYQYTTQNRLEKLSDSISKNQLSDSLSEAGFHIILRKYISNIGCGHTVALPSRHWYKKQGSSAQLLPFNIDLIGERLFINHTSPGDSLLKPGDEILMINGRSTAHILSKMRAIISGDGRGYRFIDYKIKRSFRTYYLFLFGGSAQYEIQYLDSNKRLKIKEMAASRKLAKDASAPDGYSYQPLISGHRASFGISREDSTVGILDIDGFSRQGYKKFYRNVFKIASDRKINHLVIDLRHNGGGYFPNGNRLLSYFMDSSFTMDFERPIGTIRESKYLSLPFFSQVTQWVFNLLPDQNKRDSLRNYAIPYRQIKRHHWKHNTYVLTDGGTFSMASYVATKLKAFCRATVIGTETGGGEEGSNAILMYKLILPHSQNRISIPLYHLNHGVNPELIGHGLIPKIITEGTPITVMEGIDLAMKEFYELIDSNR